MTKKKEPKQWSGKLDGYLASNLKEMKGVIKKDWDMVFIVDGFEGTGKSVLAQQCAKFCDPDFNIDRVCFNAKEFMTAINSASKFQAVVFDEAYSGLSSRAALSEVNRGLVQMLAEIRQKNLWVFIVLPCFFELDKYAAVWRSRGLLHVYTGKNMERGFFSFYSQDRKKNLYILGKKFYSYSKQKCNFYGRFTKGYAVDEKAYRQKKLNALKDYTKEKPKTGLAIRYKETIAGFIEYIKQSGDITYEEIGAIVGKDRNFANNVVNQVKRLREAPKPLDN